MLTKTSLAAAYPLAERLAAHGFVLKALDQTPLSELINASLCQQQIATMIPSKDVSEMSAEATDNSMNLLQGASYADPNGRVAHDEIMEAAVKTVGGAVSYNLNLAKNVVKPIIQSVVEQTKTYMDVHADSTLSILNVVPYFYKAIWDSPVLAELANAHANLPVSDMPLQALQIQIPDTMLPRLLLGSGHFDQEITEFYNTLGEHYCRRIWDALFGPRPYESLAGVLRHEYDSFDAAVLAYLYARRLQDDIPTGVNMDLSQWRAYVSTIMANAGRQIVRVFEKRALDLRTRRLVIQAPRGDSPQGDIVVVGDVYNRWLAEGGSPEILFGSVLSDGDTGYATLLENKERYETNWKRELAMLQSKKANARFTALVAGLRQALNDAVLALPEEYLAVERAQLLSRIPERLAHATAKDLQDVWHVARKAVCRVMFPHTDAEAILLAIDTAATANPELDIREAALLATVDYVARWISALYVVESVPDTAA